MVLVAARLLADTGLVALLLFASAGTLDWKRAWGLLALLLLVLAGGAVLVARVHPSLLRERATLPIHAEQPCSDRVLLLAVLATGFLGLPAIAGLDVFRWHVLPPPAPGLSAWGLVLFVLGWYFTFGAMKSSSNAGLLIGGVLTTVTGIGAIVWRDEVAQLDRDVDIERAAANGVDRH